MDNVENRNHLNKFSSGGSSLVTNAAYDDYMCECENIGFPASDNDIYGSMYIMPREELDHILSEANGDISKVEKTLGLPEGHFGDDSVIRVDINDVNLKGLRVANGYESGANEFWNTKIDLDGNLPNIQYVKDVEGNNTRNIDTAKTDPKELSKVNGQYWDEKGMYHPPNQEAYDGKTSAGINEAVINQVKNTPENVSYTELSGFSRGHNSEVSATPITDGYVDGYNNMKENIEKLGVPFSNAPPSSSNKSDFLDVNNINNEFHIGIRKENSVDLREEKSKNDNLVFENVSKEQAVNTGDLEKNNFPQISKEEARSGNTGDELQKDLISNKKEAGLSEGEFSDWRNNPSSQRGVNSENNRTFLGV